MSQSKMALFPNAEKQLQQGTTPVWLHHGCVRGRCGFNVMRMQVEAQRFADRPAIRALRHWRVGSPKTIHQPAEEK